MPLIWPWLDWTNAITSLPIALIGFGVALQQIVKTRGAADAARDSAIEATNALRNQITTVTLSSLLPQLVRLEDSVRLAIRLESDEFLTHVISNWIWQAGLCRAYLNESDQDQKKTLILIQSSISAATTLKPKTSGLTTPEQWRDETARLRMTIAKAAASFGEIVGNQAMKESS